jgi:2-deoxy-D-gluconate 3-dehydrogenase
MEDTLLKEYSLEGKVAIVTGAGRGLGQAIALALAEAGANIVAAARTQSEIDHTAEQVHKLGRRSLALATDVTNAEQVAELVKETAAQFGHIDILVNNAGIAIIKALVPMPRLSTRTTKGLTTFEKPISGEEWDKAMNTNLRGPVLCTQAVGPYMMQQRSGKIINISSLASARGLAYHTLYNITKAGLSMFTRVMAVEWARFHINVNAIGAGYIHTAMSHRAHTDPKLFEQMMRDVPLKRAGQPHEVGLLAVYLASAASDYMTGQTVYLDGGFTA